PRTASQLFGLAPVTDVSRTRGTRRGGFIFGTATGGNAALSSRPDAHLRTVRTQSRVSLISVRRLSPGHKSGESSLDRGYRRPDNDPIKLFESCVERLLAARTSPDGE